jgi:hypothetical protein
MSVPRVAVPLILAVLAGGCLGPRPVLERQTLEPFQRHGTAPFVVEAVVRNDGRGSGQIEVEASIMERATGRVVARDETTVTLDAWERESVVVTMPRPPSSADLSSDDVDLRVEVRYPIQ